MEKKKIKVCKNCQLEKFEKEFYKVRRGKGRVSVCKECRRVKQREYYNKNKEKIIEYCKAYYYNNKLKVQEVQYKWKEKNQDKILEYRKKYYHDHKPKEIALRTG